MDKAAAEVNSCEMSLFIVTTLMLPSTTLRKWTMLVSGRQRCSHTQPPPQLPSASIVGLRMLKLSSCGAPIHLLAS